MKRTLFILLVILLILAILPAAGLAASTTNVSTTAELNTAIANAASGDTIFIEDGTYALDETLLSKNLIIIGESEDGVVLTPSANATYWVKVETGSSLSVKNLTMDGAGFDILRGIYTTGTLSVEDSTFKNIINPGYGGMALSIYQDPADPSASLSVKNVTMSNIGRIGIHAKGDTTVDGFYYTGKGNIDCLDYAMEIGSIETTSPFTVSVSNAVITDCLGVASVDDSGSVGLYVNTFWYSYYGGTAPLITVTMDNIDFANCSVGLYVGYMDDTEECSDTLIMNSNFAGCTEDIVYVGKVPAVGSVTTQNNYYGGGEPTVYANDGNVIAGLDDYLTSPIPRSQDTDVTAGVDSTYMIIIPAAVDFGTLIKDSGVQTQDFPVEAQGTIIEPGASVLVTANGPFVMKNNDGSGEVLLNFQLWNSLNQVGFGDEFTSFTGDRTEDGTVRVDTADITAAGSYRGTMDFTISYEMTP